MPKFSQERFKEAQQYSGLFYKEIYNRIPNVYAINTLECSKDNLGPMGARDVLTINDFFYNIDAVVISDDKDLTNFQFKTTSSNNVWFDVIAKKNETFRSIKGAYVTDDKAYFITCGDAHVIAFYMINREKMYFFDCRIIRNLFRWEDAWKKGEIKRSDSGAAYIKFDIDIFLDCYKEYSAYLLGGCTNSDFSQYAEDNQEF